MPEWKVHRLTGSIVAIGPQKQVRTYSNKGLHRNHGQSGHLFWAPSDTGNELTVIDLAKNIVRQLDLPAKCTEHCARRDGVHLLLYASERLIVVDMEKMRIVHDLGLPGAVELQEMAEADDGAVLLSVSRDRKDKILCCDILQGSVEEQAADQPRYLTVQDRRPERWPGFHGFSPDGRYVLRPDLSALRFRRKPGVLSLLGAGHLEYCIMLQLWQTRPLQYVRTLKLAWIDVRRTPGYRWDEGREGNDFAAIAEMSDKANRNPELWEAQFTAFLKGDGKIFDFPLKHWVEFATEPSMIRWSSDCRSFWCTIKRFVVQADVDGRFTPMMSPARLRKERHPRVGHAVWNEPLDLNNLPRRLFRDKLVDTERPKELHVINSTDVRLVYAEGEAVLTGELKMDVGEAIAFVSNDRWSPRDTADDQLVERARTAFLRSARRLTLTLPDLDEASVRRCIEMLMETVPDGILQYVFEDRIDIVFDIGGEQLTEAAFFETIGERFPGLMDDIGRLLGKFADWGNPEQYWSDDNDTVLFGSAALVYAQNHGDPFPVLKRFCHALDDQHTEFSPKRLLPVIYDARGCTPDVIDFVIWFCGETYNHYGVIFRMLERPPFQAYVEKIYSGPEFARHVIERIRTVHQHRVAKDSFYLYNTVSSIIRKSRAHSHWTGAMLQELERIVPGLHPPAD
jgi:hypothetical protein